MSQALETAHPDIGPDSENAVPSFGTLSAASPDDREAKRPKFRIAVLGDFSGRTSRAEQEIGAELAQRKPIRLDFDTLDAVIERFATTLVLAIGADGEAVEVPLGCLDDLHPDEIYENVSVFADLAELRQRVARGDGVAAIREMQGWAQAFGAAKPKPRGRARGTTVPADCKLADFKAFLGNDGRRSSASAATEALTARIVAPHVQAAPDPMQETMLDTIDSALSDAMRTILHHPEFQAIEATWRSLELLARRVETGASLEVVLYDVSAEEWAADLSAVEDLAESGLFKMLAEEPRLDAAQGPLSAVFGLYTLEETPPHAELMGRMAQIAEWMNAPFLAAISPRTLDTAKDRRHPLVADYWDALRALPEASYTGLATPRFLMRLPYGARTEPVDPFEFEEFSVREGLKGMLWGNPVVLSAILLAETVNRGGTSMKLGDVMSLDDMPVHVMTDSYGDQIALPCTERLLSTSGVSQTVARGLIPLVSIKGRAEVRQASFQGLGSGLLAGPWGQSAGAAGVVGRASLSLAATASRDAPSGEATADPSADSDDEDPMGDLGLEDARHMDFDFDTEADTDLDTDFELEDDDTNEDAGSDDLDALLAGFGDDDGSDDVTGDDDQVDPELAAILEGL